MPATRISSSSVIASFAAGGIVLLLGAAGVHYQSQLLAMKSEEAVRTRLVRVAQDITAEIERILGHVAAAATSREESDLVDAARSASLERYPGWWAAGNDLEFVDESSAQPYTEQALAQVQATDSDIVGPIPTMQGEDVIFFQAHVVQRSERDSARIGVSVPLTELLNETGVLALAKDGLNVTLTSADGRITLWSTQSALSDAAYADVNLPGQAWRLSAQPKGGWFDTNAAYSGAVIVVLLGLGYGFWYLYLALRPARLEADMSELEGRLIDRDAEVSTLLRSRSQLETQLTSSLTVDLTTGLPNRTSFVEHVQSSLARCRLESGDGILIATLQLPKLDSLSQSMGATVAHEIVCEVAERLKEHVEGMGFLARIGEKEFALCTTRDRTLERQDLAEEILSAIDDRFTIGHRTLYAPAVVGIATSPDGYAHGPELLTQASLAATTAVESGQRWSMFDPETKEARISLLQLEADMQKAVEQDQLRLHFQPIVDIAHGTVVGFEALLRWRHPTESWISPERFIPLAESIGQMSRISEWVIRQVIAYCKQWLPLRDVPVYVTINLTPRDLNRELCNVLFSLLKEYEIPPGCIRIEVTETAIIRDFRVAARLISELNERGIRVLLDDFGTGYSSLSYLRDLPFYAVKIDKSFIQRMATEARDFGLVRSIINLVHYLGMECVAEGIETQEQLDLIEMANCSYGQGYLFSAPVPPGEAELLISKGAGDDTRKAAS